jgi:small membrane protein
MNLFQIVFVPLCGLLALRAMFRTYCRRVGRRSDVLAALAWSVAALLITWPSASIEIASRLGIGRGADLIFYLAILGGLSVSFYFYGRYRHLEILTTELVRQQAIDRARKGTE